MGAVFEVVDLRSDRRRALKVMHPHLVRGPAQRRRFDGNGDRMQVNDAVETVMFGLPRDPVPDRAEVVADVFVARRLDAREDACHG